MKTANISIDTAKAMYQQGGAAKKFALDNFTEQELTKKALPKTWEEAVKGKEGWYIDTDSISKVQNTHDGSMNKNLWPTRELAEACLALSQLAVLRKTYRDSYKEGWEPDWTISENKWCISFFRGKIDRETSVTRHIFLSFPTQELSGEFMSNFESLILKAQPLL